MTKHKATKKKTSNTTKSLPSNNAENNRKSGSTNDNPAPPQPASDVKISASARRFILKSIAEYQPYKLIKQELERKYGFVRSEDTLRHHYGCNPQYKPQIQKYRDRYNAGISEEPLSSRRHLLSILYETLDEARSAGDYKGVASITKQIREMLGYHVNPEIQVNHNHSGGLTLEQKLAALLSNPQAPPPLEQNGPPLLPDSQVLDVTAEEIDPT